MKKLKWWHSLHTRSSLALIIIAAVMIEVSGAVQFYFARNGIQKEVDERAQSEMKMKSLKICRESQLYLSHFGGICRKQRMYPRLCYCF